MIGMGLDGMTTTHGGIVKATTTTCFDEGKPLLRVGDGFFCPKCKVWSTLLDVYPQFVIDGRAVVTIRAKFTCGAELMGVNNHTVMEYGSGSGLASQISYFRDPDLNNSLVDEKTELLNGYYYNADTGFFEGQVTTGKGNNLDVYTCTAKISADKFEGVKKVPISNHNTFISKGSVVYGESSAFRSEKNDELKYEMFAIAYVFERNTEAYGGASDQAKRFRGTTPEAKNNTKMQYAIAAVINVLYKGNDYSNGANMWDGAEQAMYPASDKRRSTGKYELHMNTMGWTISDEHYAKWKKNVGKSFVAPQHHPAPENYGGYKNKGKMRLRSTAVYNRTIFWSSK